MKVSVNDGRTKTDRVADKSVLAPFPGLAYLSLEIALNILVKAGWIA
jgi:hypothetical protein